MQHSSYLVHKKTKANSQNQYCYSSTQDRGLLSHTLSLSRYPHLELESKAISILKELLQEHFCILL